MSAPVLNRATELKTCCYRFGLHFIALGYALKLGGLDHTSSEFAGVVWRCTTVFITEVYWG